MGGFQLEFISISLIINYMTSYDFECSHWWKIIIFLNPLQDLLSNLNAVISTNESTQFITGHVIYNPAYAYKFQLKTTFVRSNFVLFFAFAASHNLTNKKFNNNTKIKLSQTLPIELETLTEVFIHFI